MRNYAVLMGITLVVACSVDHVTVAALDAASAGEGWGEPPSGAGTGAGIGFTRCSCLEEKTQFCGSDGVTYPIECDEGDVCLPPSVDCWHACPCLPGEQGTGMGVTSSFTADCMPPTPCAGDVVCMTFTNVSPGSLTGCGGAFP